MFVPIVSLGMKQIGNRIRFGINTRQVRSLVQIAIDTGKREVVEIISPAVMETPLRRLSLPRAAGRRRRLSAERCSGRCTCPFPVTSVRFWTPSST